MRHLEGAHERCASKTNCPFIAVLAVLIKWPLGAETPNKYMVVEEENPFHKVLAVKLWLLESTMNIHEQIKD